MNNFIRISKEERGSALLLVLVLVTTFGVLSSSLLFILNLHHQNILKKELSLQSYYAAEVGVALGIEKIDEKRLDLNIGDNDLLSTEIVLDSNIKIKDIKVNNVNYEDFELTSIGNSETNTLLNETTKLNVRLGKQKPFNDLMKNNRKLFEYSLANFGYPTSYSWFFFWPVADATSSTDNLIMGQELGYLPDFKFNLLFVNFTLEDLDIISNGITIVGDIFSDQEIHLYYEDRYFEDQWENTFLVHYRDTPSETDKKYGKIPTLINTDMALTDVENLKFTGQNVYEEQNNGLFGTDYDYKREFYYEPNSYLSDLSIYGKNVDRKTVIGSDIPSLLDFINSIPSSSGDWDLRIKEDDDGKLIGEKITFSYGWFGTTYANITQMTDEQFTSLFNQEIVRIPGSLIVNEGVNLDSFGDLIIISNDGIILGAKKDTNSSLDEPVKINSDNVLLVALSKEQINKYWKEYTPIRETTDTHWLVYTDIETNSYHNEYYDDEKWEHISILTNSLTEVNGWLVADGDIIFDYKISHDKLLGNPTSPTVKISGGVIGRKIAFPENIEIAKDLYIYDWDVQYN